MQIDVPEEKYWFDGYTVDYRYFAPDAITDWLKGHGLYPKHCGSSSWGARENVKMHYIVEGASSEIALLFKLQFPDCTVHYSRI